MIIALFANTTKHQYEQLALGVIEFLRNHQVTVVMEDDQAQMFNTKKMMDINPSEIHCMISMGGDGTILQLVHTYPHITAPILGINLGHLGFMADVPISDIYPSLLDLIHGNYKVYDRLMIDGTSAEKQSCFAVNDIVIHRARNPSLIELAIFVDGVYVNTFEADGMIVSTPNGSTAYSLAAVSALVAPAPPKAPPIILAPLDTGPLTDAPRDSINGRLKADLMRYASDFMVVPFLSCQLQRVKFQLIVLS